jgi:RNA polymerase sigma factor (sigma-70 family)
METIMKTNFVRTSAVASENGSTLLHQPGFDLFQMTARFGQAETRANIEHYLDRLLPAHREVIELVDLSSKSVKEASEIIGIPQATIKTRLFYARKALADVVRYQGMDSRVAARSREEVRSLDRSPAYS